MMRFNRWVIGHPKTVLLLIVLATTLFVSQLPKLRPETNLESMFPEDHPTIIYNDLVEEWFQVKDAVVIGIFNDNNDGIFNKGSLALVKTITEGLRDMDGILTRKNSDLVSISTLDNIIGTELGLDVTPLMETVPDNKEDIDALRAAIADNEMLSSTFVSRDGKGTIIMALIENDDEQVLMYKRVKELIDSIEHGDNRVVLAGRPVIEGVFAATMQRDMPLMLRITLLVILAVLFFTFHTLRGVFMPSALVLLTLLWTFGTMAVFGVPIYTVMTMMPVILLAVGCADAIHILSKYYDEAIHYPEKSATDVTLATMEELTPPVLMTSITTMAGFLSLLSSELMPMRFFGLFIAIGIFYALVLSLTFLPAILAIMPVKVSSRKKRMFEEHGSFGRVDYAGKALYWLAGLINNKPKVIYAVAMIFILISGYGISSLNVSASLVKQFNEENPIRQADALLNSHFGGTNTLNIVFEGKGDDIIKEPSILKGIDQFQHFMEEDPDVGESVSIAEYLKRMNRVLNENKKEMYMVPETRALAAQYLFLYSMSGDPADFDPVVDYNYRKANIRFQVKKDDSHIVKGILERAELGIDKFLSSEQGEVKIAGTIAIMDVFIDLIISGQIWSIIISIILIFMLTSIEFRSIAGGLYCIIPICVSAFFNFGFMGILGVPLDVSTALTASMAIGIGVDYAIHTVSKYRLEAKKGLSPEKVTEIMLLTSGRAIWYNALVVALGFLVLLSADLVPQQKLGMMVSLTMMTCFAGAATILPALLNHFKPGFVYHNKEGENI